ncbi:MAG: hypothetical protein WBE74_20305 [Terracidiphilus sp.]
MRTELNLLGKHINMATRTRRRWLVASFYIFFLVLIAVSWLASPSGTGASFVTIEFTIFAGPILGGYLTGWIIPFSKASMVKPFGGNQVLKYCSKRSRSALSRFFYPYPAFPEANEIRSDERELNRRNDAHFVAYRILGVMFVAAFVLDFFNSSESQILALAGIPAPTVHKAIQVLLQAGYILFLTLPAAILLWTEPDMEEAR